MEKKLYYPQLDTLRLVAMLLVFSTHCYFLQLSEETSIIYNRFFVYSGIGVEFFIVLSGVLSALTYKGVDTITYIKRKVY